jgi:hypothetical protein
MAKDESNNNLSPFRDGAAGNLQNGWPANVRTSEEMIAAEQAKFDAARQQAGNSGPISINEET